MVVRCINIFLMLFLLFISLSSSYNVIRGDCEALIDRYFYRLSPYFKDMDSLNYRPPDSEFYYIMRICSNDPHSTDPYFDVFLVQFYFGNMESQSIITQNSFDYRPLNVNNFSEGIIYYADSEPFPSPKKDGTIRTLDLEYRIKCNPKITEVTNLQPDYTVNDKEITGKIIVSFEHAAGCVISDQMPTPTPTPAYSPECDYVDRYDEDTSKGVVADLRFLNDGPYGIKTIQMIKVNNQLFNKEFSNNYKIISGNNKVGNNNYITHNKLLNERISINDGLGIESGNFSLYFQPCERIQCPPGFECSHDGFSSSWLCNASRHCISYGVSNDEISFKPIDGDVSKGMRLTISEPSTSFSTQLDLTCVEDFPDGHIKWDIDGTVDTKTNTLRVKGKTNEVCLKPIPTSTPVPSEGYCKFEATKGESTLELDIQKYNNEAHGGWSVLVDVIDDNVQWSNKGTLLYKPCGPLICPIGAFCNGDEDAQIWLCNKNSGSQQICEGFGLFKNNVTLGLIVDGNISQGVKGQYFGDGKRRANVNFMCDKSLDKTVLKFSSSVNLAYKTLTFQVSAKDACPSSPDDDDSGDGKNVRLKTSGGSIFLTIFTISGIAYIAIGVLTNFVRSGEVQVPNSSFWKEFGNCVEAAVIYIATCGKRMAPVTLYNDI